MIEHIVRIWVDVKVKGASSKEAALDVARKIPVKIEETKDLELYKIQISGQVWEKEYDDED